MYARSDDLRRGNGALECDWARGVALRGMVASCVYVMTARCGADDMREQSHSTLRKAEEQTLSITDARGYYALLWQMTCPLITTNKPSSFFSMSRNACDISSKSASVPNLLSSTLSL